MFGNNTNIYFYTKAKNYQQQANVQFLKWLMALTAVKFVSEYMHSSVLDVVLNATKWLDFFFYFMKTSSTTTFNNEFQITGDMK